DTGTDTAQDTRSHATFTRLLTTRGAMLMSAKPMSRLSRTPPTGCFPCPGVLVGAAHVGSDSHRPRLDRMDAGELRARAADGARPRPLLRRHGPQEERAHHHDD